MNLHSLLGARAAAGDPIRVGLIGAGKFGAMFLAQARRTPGLHVMAIADLDVDRAHLTCGRVGWPDEAHDAADFAAAQRGGGCHITDDADALIAADRLDVVIEATGRAPNTALTITPRRRTAYGAITVFRPRTPPPGA